MVGRSMATETDILLILSITLPKIVHIPIGLYDVENRHIGTHYASTQTKKFVSYT